MTAQTSSSVAYRERLVFNWILPVGLSAGFAALLVGVIVGAVYKSPGATIPCAVMIPVLACVYLVFNPLTFEITGDEVAFGFPAYHKSFPRSALKSCEPYELTFSNYMGYGIRWGRDGTTAFNTRNGPGVKMEFEGAGKPYVVSVDFPEKICEILSETSNREGPAEPDSPSGACG